MKYDVTEGDISGVKRLINYIHALAELALKIHLSVIEMPKNISSRINSPLISCLPENLYTAKIYIAAAII
jgi:hypothetical protein